MHSFASPLLNKEIAAIRRAESALRDAALRYLTTSVSGLTDLSQDAFQQSEEFAIPLPDGYEQRKVIQLEKNGVWDTKGHYTHYCDLTTNELLRLVNLATSQQDDLLQLAWENATIELMEI